MPGIDDVLERLVTDPAFKQQLADDPRTALGGYDLSADDLELLATQVSGDAGGQTAVEQRTSKSALFGFLASLTGGGGGGGSHPDLMVDDDQSLSNKGGGGDTDALMIKEVDPMPADQGGGGSDHDAFMIKEVDPMPADDGDTLLKETSTMPGVDRGGPSPHMDEDINFAKMAPGDDGFIKGAPTGVESPTTQSDEVGSWSWSDNDPGAGDQGVPAVQADDDVNFAKMAPGDDGFIKGAPTGVEAGPPDADLQGDVADYPENMRVGGAGDQGDVMELEEVSQGGEAAPGDEQGIPSPHMQPSEDVSFAKVAPADDVAQDDWEQPADVAVEPQAAGPAT